MEKFSDKASLMHDDSALNAEVSKAGDDDTEMDEPEEVVVKIEKSEGDVSQDQTSHNGEDDDDVIVVPQEEPVVTEILDESEVLDEGAKILTESEMNITDDDVMIQEPKIETQLVPDDDDDDEYHPQPCTSDDLSQPNFIVKIKEEPKDDGYEDLVNEEDAFVEVTAIANDEMMLGKSIGSFSCHVGQVDSDLTSLLLPHPPDDAFAHSPKVPFQPSQDDNAMFDDTSMMMMPSPSGTNDELSRDLDDENNSRPESSGASAPALVGGNRKLKIVLSSLAQNSLTNKNLNSNNNVNDHNENSNLDSVNKLDSNSVELQSDVLKDQPSDAAEEPEIEYEVKPHLQAVKFTRNAVPVKRGFENSGLCSIM
jgi:hypothetical protein